MNSLSILRHNDPIYFFLSQILDVFSPCGSILLIYNINMSDIYYTPLHL